MTTATTPTSTRRRGLRARLERPGRLVGIDLARTLALVGMIATHVVVARDAAGDLTLAHQVASGRASALFAVLAGVSLALVSGGARPSSSMGRVRLGLLARAVLIGLLGLALGELDTGVAVILPAYAVLFVLALPFLGLRARTLAMLAVGWLVVSPVVSQLVRPELPERVYTSPSFASLHDPAALAADLLFTGYYPVVPWLTYLLAGLALGRCDLRAPGLPRQLIGWGVLAAVLATVVARAAVSSAQVRASLFPTRGVLTEGEAWRLLSDNQYGSTPTDGSWDWLLMVSPHSATPVDLAQTIGSALAVIGVCLLVARLLPAALRPALVVLAGAGAVPLTCYTTHLLMRTPDLPPAEVPGVLGQHLLVMAVIGAVFALAGRRGPLEWLVGWPGQLLRRTAPRS